MTKHHYFREDYFAGELSERPVEDVFRNPLSEAEKQKAIKLILYYRLRVLIFCKFAIRARRNYE